MIPPDHGHLVFEYLHMTLQDDWNESFQDDVLRGAPTSHVQDLFDVHLLERTKGNYSATMQNIASFDAVIYIPYDKETMVLCHESRTSLPQTSRFIIMPGLYI